MNTKRFIAVLVAAAAVFTETGSLNLTANAAATVINAADFGINGTDTKDDRDGIENALKKARNATADSPVTVVIPSGTYYISTPLRIYSHTTLKLQPDTIIKRSDDNQYMLSYEGAPKPSDNVTGYDKLTDVVIDGGIWDGNVKDTKKAKGLVRMTNVNHITFKNNTFKNVCGTHYMLVGASSDMTFNNVTFSDFKQFTGSEAAYEKQTGAGFKYRTAEVIHTDYINNTPCKNITVQNCTFDGIATGVGTHHTSTKRASGITVRDNTFTNCYFYAVNAASFDNLTVSGNVLTNCGGLVYAENSKGTVSGNRLTARTASGSWYNKDVTPINAIHAISSSTLTVSNNTLKNCSGYGIYANSSKLTGNGNSVTANKSKTGGSANSSLLSKSSSDSNPRNPDENTKKTQIKASDFSIGASFAYTGKQKCPAVTSSLTKDTDYTVSYGTNVKVGKGTVKITGKGKYTGTVTKTFKIIPARQKITVSKNKTGAKVKWKKDTSASKYLIRYSTTRNFKKYSTVTAKSSSNYVKFTIPAGQTYYVKVMTVATVNGATYKSKWSAVKAVSRKK